MAPNLYAGGRDQNDCIISITKIFQLRIQYLFFKIKVHSQHKRTI